jgi:hypothetical protein
MTTPQSPVTYAVCDLPQRLLEEGTTSVRVRLTRRACKRGAPRAVGNGLGDWVYEPLVTTLPSAGFLATDVLDRSYGRGAFAGTLADADRAGDPDRWCARRACGQACWHIVWQGVWNLRLACSTGCAQAPLHEMEWAPPHPPTDAAPALAEPAPGAAPAYGALTWAPGRGGRLGAAAFALHDEGTLRCPHGGALGRSETRQEHACTPRLVCMARDADGAACPRRSACRGQTASGTRGRRVSAVGHRHVTAVVLHPRPGVAAAAVRWNAGAGRQVRRTWMAQWRQPTVTVAAMPPIRSPPARPPRAARSHRRLSWPERLGRHARGPLLVTRIPVSGVTPQVLELLPPHVSGQSGS